MKEVKKFKAIDKIILHEVIKDICNPSIPIHIYEGKLLNDKITLDNLTYSFEKEDDILVLTEKQAKNFKKINKLISSLNEIKAKLRRMINENSYRNSAR